MKHFLATLSVLFLLTACFHAVEPPQEPEAAEMPNVQQEEAKEVKEIKEVQKEPDAGTTMEVPVPGFEDIVEMIVEDAGGAGGADEEEEALSPSRTRIVEIVAKNFSFTPSHIIVQEGEKVVLRITGGEAVHGYAVKGLNINLAVQPGQTMEVDLPTDKPGSYTVFCSIVCGAGHSDMIGLITIEPK